MNKHWPRWVRSSILKHFADRRNGVDVFIEGGERQTSGLSHWAEIRMDGPFAREVSKGCWELTVEINILISSLMDKDNLYKIEQPLGIMFAAFETNIAVFKYGEGDEDDQSILGCLQVLGNDPGVVVSRFGQIEPDVNIEQATVEGHYRMRLVL